MLRLFLTSFVWWMQDFDLSGPVMLPAVTKNLHHISITHWVMWVMLALAQLMAALKDISMHLNMLC